MYLRVFWYNFKLERRERNRRGASCVRSLQTEQSPRQFKLPRLQCKTAHISAALLAGASTEPANAVVCGSPRTFGRGDPRISRVPTKRGNRLPGRDIDCLLSPHVICVFQLKIARETIAIPIQSAREQYCTPIVFVSRAMPSYCLFETTFFSTVFPL